jgi:hypothetical protein
LPLPCPYRTAQVVGGTISGTVSDPTGAVIANAKVLVHNDETGNERHLTTGTDGRFPRPPSPSAATPSASTPAASPPTSRTGIPLSVGPTRQPPCLSVTGVAKPSPSRTFPRSSISPPSRSPAWSTRARSRSSRSTAAATTSSSAEPRDRELHCNQRSGSVGTSNSSVGNMFAVSGRRPQDNLFLLNGVEYTGASLINVTPGGTSGQLLGVEGVREFNVITDTYSAAYGKRQGAQVSIVTASGTNTCTAPPTSSCATPSSTRATTSTPAASRVPAQQLRRIAGRAHQEGQALPLRQLRGLSPEPRRDPRHAGSRQQRPQRPCSQCHHRGPHARGPRLRRRRTAQPLARPERP